jgi:uncharacterized protein YegP (UPF0339 family)
MPNKTEFNYKILKNKWAKQPYHWVCVASNGQIRSVSENYAQKHSAINAVKQEIRYRVKGSTTFEDLTGETNKIQRRFKS